MRKRERRTTEEQTAARLRQGLTAAQLRALETLEQFQWTLAFVRRPLFQDPVPVVSDRSGARRAVLRPDGTLDESPELQLRD